MRDSSAPPSVVHGALQIKYRIAKLRDDIGALMEIAIDLSNRFLFGGGILTYIIIFMYVITTKDDGSLTGLAFTRMQALIFSAFIFIGVYLISFVPGMFFAGGSSCPAALWIGDC